MTYDVRGIWMQHRPYTFGIKRYQEAFDGSDHMHAVDVVREAIHIQQIGIHPPPEFLV